MSTAAQRRATIEQNYTDALKNEPHDLARAKKPEDVTAIQANVAMARKHYYSAIATELTKNGESVETAFQAAKKAGQDVSDARNAAASIPTLISRLTFSTNAAGNLLSAARK